MFHYEECECGQDIEHSEGFSEGGCGAEVFF